MSEGIESRLQYQPIAAIQNLENQISIYSGRIRENRVYFDETTDKMIGAWALDMLLLRWIQQSIISDNPRNIMQLNYVLEEYNKENTGANLCLDDLVSNGLVRIVWNTYYLPQRFILTRKEISEQSEHTLRFMQRLSKVPYPDTCVIQLQNVEQQLQEHKAYYPETPEIAWFLENDVLKKDEQNYLLNYHSVYVKNCSDFLLSRLWMEKKIGPADSNNRLDWWISYVLLISDSNKFIHAIKPLSLGELLDACCDRLLKEEDIIGWEEERQRLAAEAFPTPEFVKMNKYISEISLPKDDSDLEKLFWFNQATDAAIYIHDPREILGMLFQWIIVGEGQGTVWEDRPRLHKLLSERSKRPLYIMNF